ncbi:MAG: iron ABC transporter permease, partial [Rhodospirillaceae bacterium]|nr:iron ABC transporter permease [Rhodospirillaceae bacterium]
MATQSIANDSTRNNANNNGPSIVRFLSAKIDGWTISVLLIAIVVSVPIVTVIGLAIAPNEDIWRHLFDTVLGRYVRTTLILMTGVGFGTFVIGTGTAWIVTMCNFPGKKFFEWGLLLPMAVPAYVIAYVYTDILQYSGPLQAMLRDTFAWETKSQYWFPEIRSIGGAITMMTMVLYPYVYLLARSAFLEQSVCVLEASRTLGRGPWRGFFRVALPMARPAIAVGVSLVMMETLNDFGTVDFFAVATFTAGIFDVWLNMNSPSGAAQLASVLLLFVGALVTLERIGRRGRKFHNTSSHVRKLPGYQLHGFVKWLAVVCLSIPVIAGFIIPAGVLGRYVIDFHSSALDASFWDNVVNSLMLSGVAGFVAVGVGIVLAYGLRLGQNRAVRFLARFAAMGYAVPGAVLGIGIIVSLGWIDNSIDGAMKNNFSFSTGLILSGTIAAVVFGYLSRFLSLSFGTLDAGLTKITPSMEGAARTLGLN